MITAALYEVFADGPGGGNPCAIVTGGEGLTTAEMTVLATGYGVETAFLLTAGGGGARMRLRFFSPGGEISLCGHATLAAMVHEARLHPHSERDHDVETAAGILRGGRFSGERAWLELLPPSLHDCDVDLNELAHALGAPISALDWDWPPTVASVGRAKLLVRLVSRRDLDELHPDRAAIARLCDRLDVTGMYPYAVVDGAQHVLSARQFPWDVGVLEDAATAVAAGALGAALADEPHAPTPYECIVLQGRAMGRPSRIAVTVSRTARNTLRVMVDGIAVLTREEAPVP